MSNLTIVNHGGQQTINSRDVAEMIDMQHKDLLEKIRGYSLHLTSGKIRPLDFFIESTYQDAKGEERPCYLLTRKGCDMVANKLTGEKGVLFSAAYINKFHEMEQAQIPRSLPEALRLAADLAEKNELLAARVEADAPKVLFADSVSAAHTSILIGELAKLIKQNGRDIGQNRLFEWMRQNGFLISRKGTDFNMPTQRSMDLKLFSIKETTINKPDGSIHISKTVKVTGKGQIYFINAFCGEKNGEAS